MKIFYITVCVLVALALIIIAIDNLILSRFKNKNKQIHINVTSDDICVICGAKIATESGRHYCKNCLEKWSETK